MSELKILRKVYAVLTRHGWIDQRGTCEHLALVFAVEHPTVDQVERAVSPDFCAVNDVTRESAAQAFLEGMRP